MFAQWKHNIWLTSIVVVVAILAGAFPDEPVAHAQGENRTPADVGIFLEVPDDPQASGVHKLYIIVVNQGSRTAYDVKVKVDVVYPAQSHFSILNLPTVPLGNASVDGTSLRWTIPALGRLQREAVTARVTHAVSSQPAQPSDFDNSAYPHELFGEVTTSSYDSNLRNNTARVWSYDYSFTAGGTDTTRQVLGNYSVSVTVDNPNPAPGGTVNFTIKADRTNPYGVTGETPPPIDLKVDVELTDGLTVTGTPTYAPAAALRADSVSYSDGVFTIGTLKQGKSRKNSVTLPITVASSAVVNKQCLTAKLTGNPPPGVGEHEDDISDNVAKVCLGDQPVEPFVRGQVDAFTVYPCVGITTEPCDNTDDVKVRAVDKTVATERILNAGDVTINIVDGPGRTYDGQMHNNVLQSVNSANEVSWQTAIASSDVSTDFSGTVRGVKIGFNRGPFNDHLASWSKMRVKFTVEGANGDPPGTLHVRNAANGRFLFALNSGNSWERSVGPFNLTSEQNAPIRWFLEFEKLGLYTVEFSAEATHTTNAGDCDTDGNNANDAYCTSETYTFHVGPLSDLAVKDAGASSSFTPERPALAVIAINNELARASGVQVTGLPTGAEVIDISQGSYNRTTGVWNVGELKVRDYYRSRGEPEPILVLAAAAGETATVSIASSKDYEVCVGPKSNPRDLAHTTQAACEAVTNASWNSTPVYDYNADNNTATIRARGGGVSGTSGGPAAPRFATQPVLTWEAVPHVNDWPVHRYQVQYLRSNDWVNLAEVPGSQTHFTDTDSSSGRTYRVRALNEAGVPGFWSRSASRTSHRQASPPLNVTAVAGAAGEVVVSWDPSVDDEGSPITYYQVQWSRSGTGGWSNACRSEGPSDLSCTQTGIPAGETRYYRVAAHTAQGTGVWSDLAVATTIPGVPSAPRGLSASRAPQDLGGETILAIRLTWNAPATDNGSAIYSYAVEYVDYDQSAGRCGTDWKYLGSDPSVHSNDPPTREFIDTGEYEWVGLEPGAHRCYRVSAINSAGEGPFSNVARASAGGEVPPEWMYLDGEADGQDAITLYWGEPYYDGGAPVTSYQLQYSEDGDNWRNLTSTSGSARSYTHTGRKVGETWYYRIRARNSAGWSEWSDSISVTLAEGATADISQPSLTVRVTSSTEVLLSWNSLCNPNKEGDCENKGIDGYMVEYSEDGGLYGWEQLTWFWTDQTKVVDFTVAPGATRYYRVSGYQEVDRRKVFGRWSQAKTATTADFVVGAPQNFTITAEGERGLKLVWDEVTEGRDASSITGYRIERNTPGDGSTDFDTSWVARQTNHKNTTYVETGLTPGTDYYYRVAAVTRNGSVPYIGRYSDIERFFIPPTGG